MDDPAVFGHKYIGSTTIEGREARTSTFDSLTGSY